MNLARRTVRANRRAAFKAARAAMRKLRHAAPLPPVKPPPTTMNTTNEVEIRATHNGPPAWVDLTVPVFARLRNLTDAAAEEWLERNAEPRGGGWYRIHHSY